MCGVLHNSRWKALFLETSLDVCFTWVLHHLQNHVCCILLSQLPQPFNYLLSPPNSLTMFAIWPFPDFNSQGIFYMLSFKILPPSIQPIFPFYPHPMSFEPTERMIFDAYISLLDFYDNTNVLSKVSFIEYAWSKDIGTFGSIWHTKLGKLKNWLTIMSY
jgi:hypothetical protein